MNCLIATLTAAFVALAGLGIGANRLSGQKTLEQQEQSQFTYVSDFAGTSKEPEQAPEQNGEPTPEEIPEVDVDKQKDEPAQEEKEAQPAESAQAEVPDLTADMVYNCNDACHQVAVLNGIDSAESICGEYGAKQPISVLFVYKKCAESRSAEEVTAEANKIIDDATTEFKEMWSNQEQQPNTPGPTLTNMIISRAKEHGLDLTTRCGSSSYTDVYDAWLHASLNQLLRVCGARFNSAMHFLNHVVVNSDPNHWMDRYNCEWLKQDGHDCSYLAGARCATLPFCEANKDFPGCEQFLDIYGNCEKILADAANKNEL